MIIRQPDDIPSSEITPESVYLDRRRFLRLGAAGALGATLVPGAASACDATDADTPQTQDELTPFADVTSYNNFYEYGTDKSDPARYAPGLLETEPWSVAVEGHCARPGRFDLDGLLAGSQLQDRVYRLRCVEGWSMVIPWRGIPLADVINRAQPTSQAKYVEFHTLLDPEQMPYQKTSLLDWPYVEGLRMDEALHPLSLLATGLYGRDMPAQNGAPIRLVVPWKYGFKSIKSIVRIRFVEQMPTTTWVRSAPSEYGFYANVNPAVDHPRWSQARERRIGEIRRRDTMPFNGYANQVAALYRGMDLRRWF